ncbi:bZIP transcription factor 27-like [Phoenix dactylifera]|uniref:BZIP transcription factor 27-like n=1 Tax=Phoenix dactylifera TaxID=42345 RepID=A0A8B8ZIN6_PHODC|nr:bZIP transcription factor 27-like [Phoenix dactylifera]
MWSSGLDKHSNKKKNSNNNSSCGHGGSSRIVSSSSSSRSSPSSTSSILPQTPRRRNMEEVWKDINLTTLHHERPLASLLEQHSHPHHHHHHHRAMILQDFLSGPCSTVAPADAAVEDIPLPPPPPLLPPTALSLSSGLELQCLGGGGGRCGCARITGHSGSSSNSNGSRVNCQAINSSSNNNNVHGGPFMSPSFSDAVIGPPSPAGLFSFCSRKRMMPDVPVIGGDRRHKRMIKNRESAARSRARKQAYTTELELEVAHLVEENAKLKKQLEELRLAMAAQLPNRIALKRSSSAPF